MKKILILGGGFGGIRAVLDLERKLKANIKNGEIEITLIDKNNYHLFVSALYEVASATGIKRDPFSVRLRKSICIPHADIFEKKLVNLVQAEVSQVNLDGKFIKTRGDKQYDFDYLVLGLGSQSSDFDIPGVREYAYKFKTLEDALLVNERMETLINDAAKGKRQLPVDILIGGGGFTGIEVASELACCAKSIARKCGLKGRCSSLVLFEAASKILPMASDKERKIIKKRLTKHGVIIMENSTIEEVGDNFVRLKNGQKIKGDLVVWTAGVKANDLIYTIKGLPLSEKGKILIDDKLSVKGFQNIFAIGDIAEFVDPATNKALPAMAFIAYEEGNIAASNIINSIKNKKFKAYKPVYNIWIAPVGGKFAVAHINGFTISGFWGWALRSLVDLRYMIQILPFFKALSVFWDEITLFTKND